MTWVYSFWSNSQLRIASILLTLGCALASPASAAILEKNESVTSANAPQCTSTLEAGKALVTHRQDAANVPLDGTIIISPPVFNISNEAQATDTLRCTLTIRNRVDEPMQLELRPLGMAGSHNLTSGGREYFDASDQRFTKSMGPWIDPAVATVKVLPREVVDVPFDIRIPASPSQGAAYGGIGVVSRSKHSSTSTAVGVESMRVSSIMLRLSGSAKPKLKLHNIDSPRIRFNRENWPLTATLTNRGTLHATPQTDIRIRSIFGNEVAVIRLAQGRLLPNASALIEAKWPKVPWLGLYRWQLSATDDSSASSFGKGGATASGWFLALPPWWVLLVVIVLLTVVATHRVKRTKHDHEELDDEDSDENFT